MTEHMARRCLIAGALLTALAWRCLAVVRADQVAQIVDEAGLVAGPALAPGLHAWWPWQRLSALPAAPQRLEVRGARVRDRAGRSYQVDVAAWLRLAPLAVGAGARASAPLASRWRECLADAVQAGAARTVVALPAVPQPAAATAVAADDLAAAMTRTATSDGRGEAGTGAGGAPLAAAIEEALRARCQDEGVAQAHVLVVAVRDDDADLADAVRATIAWAQRRHDAEQASAARRRDAADAAALADAVAVRRRAELEASRLRALAAAQEVALLSAARREAPLLFEPWHAARALQRGLGDEGPGFQLWLGPGHALLAPLWHARPRGPVVGSAGNGLRAEGARGER